MKASAQPLPQNRSWGRRALYMLLLAFAVYNAPIFRAESADWMGTKGLRPTTQPTGEKPSPDKSGVETSNELVKPAQKPAADIEGQIKNFQGQRGPGDEPIELSGHMRNGEFVIDQVDPNGPYGDKKPGDTLPAKDVPATQPAHDSH